jgi:hypothetical protein
MIQSPGRVRTYKTPLFETIRRNRDGTSGSTGSDEKDRWEDMSAVRCWKLVPERPRSASLKINSRNPSAGITRLVTSRILTSVRSAMFLDKLPVRIQERQSAVPNIITKHTASFPRNDEPGGTYIKMFQLGDDQQPTWPKYPRTSLHELQVLRDERS